MTRANLGDVLSEQLARFAAEAAKDPKREAMATAVRELWDRHRLDEQRRTLRVVLEESGAKLSPKKFEAIAHGRVDPSFETYQIAKRFLESDEQYLVLGGTVGIGKSFSVLAALAEVVLKPRIRQWAADVAAKIDLGEVDVRRSPSENLASLAPPTASHRIVRGFEWWLGSALSVTWEPWAAELAKGSKPGNRDASILVVDDLATGEATSREAAALEALVEHRMTFPKTIFTTNANPTQLRERYGVRAGERIGDEGLMVYLSGPSRRRGSAW